MGRAVTEARALSEEQKALLAFSCVGGIGPATLVALRAAFGSLAEAARAERPRLLPHLKSDEARKNLGAAGALLERAETVLAALARLEARLLLPESPDWPHQLRGAAFPALLFVRGTLAPEARRIALVGARACDPYGLEQAAHFSATFVRAGVEVVSGGALGVDAAAHRAALRNGGVTLAVVGTGLDKAYPSEHRELYDAIVQGGGAVVSLFPPGTPPATQNFIVRNRLIAALSDATLVARAGRTSGALGTAKAAQALGRPVYVIPGDITSSLSEGGNRLLEQGARAAPSPEALLGSLGCAPPKPLSAPAVETLELPPPLSSVHQALGSEPLQFDELVVRCQLEPGALASALLQLELMGLCAERPGKLFVRSGTGRTRLQEARN